MKKALLTTRNVVGTAGMLVGAAGLVWAGFVFVSSLPELRRYVRIIKM
jgi:hypothetical protein